LDKLTIIEARTKLRQGKPELNKINIIADNMILASERIETVIWDDDKQVVNVFKSNRDPVTQDVYPIEIMVFDYSVIQYLRLATDKDEFEKYADDLISKGLMTETQKQTVIKKYVIPDSEFLK
jgi:tRNA(Ser,Leu) C12 N-acetylase TAN1